VDGGQSVRT